MCCLSVANVCTGDCLKKQMKLLADLFCGPVEQSVEDVIDVN